MSYFQHSSELPEWVGKPPAGWRSDWLKWHVHLSTERPSDDEAENLPYIANEDIASWTGKLLNPDPQPADADSRKFLLDDVLFNKLRPYLAKVFHAPFSGVSSGELLCLRGSKNVLPRYLFYVVSSKAFVDAINAETFGSKMPRADWETVGHQPLPLPPLETQKRIAAFLDEKTAQIDGLIEKKRALLDRLAEKRQAIITQAVTKGLNPAAPMKDSGIDWLGQIPAHWEVVMAKYLITAATSGPRGWSEMTTDTGALFFRSQNIGRSMDVTLDDVARVEPEDNAESQRARLQSDDVVVCITGARTGAVAHINGLERAYINQHVCLLRPFSDMIMGRFIAYSLSSYIGQEQLGMAMYGLKQGLGLEQVRSLSVICPSKVEQEGIVAFLDEATTKIDTLITTIGRTVDLLKEHRSALITAAVTGQLEV